MLIFQISAIIVSLLSSLINFTAAKVYSKCELAKELSEIHGIAYEDVGTYVCIAERQSNFNTQAVGQGQYYGMYQMSSEYWCDIYGRGKACNLNCNDLLDNDLSDDLRCMRMIIDEHQRLSGNGFNAWPSGRSCQSIASTYIADCSIESNQIITSYNNNNKKVIAQQKKTTPGNVGRGKVYERCELARELKYKHNIRSEHIATWVCIAKHESNFNTSAIGRLNWDGSEDHGLFQISDIYWCDENRSKACGLRCDELEDNDISNDVECIKTIHDEHTRLFGDGFQAWAVYPRCKGQSDSYIDGCFDDSDNEIIPIKHQQPGIQQPSKPKISHHRSSFVGTGKVYERCELAKELKNKHNIPINQIATWVCIAKHESNFNTSAIGRLNWDGSEDHGLFQISDIYWCDENRSKACGLTCTDLRDNDITDDIKCIRQIHEEHTRLSGDGFNAWAVYPRCKGQSNSYIKGCLIDDDSSNEILPFTPKPGIQQQKVTAYSKTISQRKHHEKIPGKGKVYERCELAQELRYKHKIPMEAVATWVCIAKHESNFNTSAIGRLNWDGSEDHGLFQISDIYWCDEKRSKACGLRCDELEDNDITDDVECMLKIHEEHTFLSGDGFNAWAVYRPHCQGRSESYINGCFNDDNENFISDIRPAITQPVKTSSTTRKATTTTSTIRKIVTTKTTTRPTTTFYRSPTTVKAYHKSDEPQTTESSYDTTLIDTTTLQPVKTSTKWNWYTQSPSTTQKAFNSLFNSFQTANKNDLTIQQKSIVNKLSTNKLPSTISTKALKNYGSSSSTFKPIDQFNNDAKKTTTKFYQASSTSTAKTTKSTIINSLKSSTKKPITTTTTTQLRTTTTTPTKTTTRKPITQKTTLQVKSTTTKKNTNTTPFNVFAFYLNDYTSKAPAIQYKPIQFGEKSTVIFKKLDTSIQQPNVKQVSSTLSYDITTTKKPISSTTTTTTKRSTLTTTQRPTTTTTTTTSSQIVKLRNDENIKNVELKTTRTSSILNLIPSQYNFNNNAKSFDSNRIGRLVGNITPHSVDYLLKLTTPRTFYG